VLGVSPGGRYVVVSDVARGLVFLIDTTGTKAATEYRIPNIVAATFAADADAPGVNLANGSKLWIGGSDGIYDFQADTFVLTPSSTSAGQTVNSLAWMLDGQSYFGSGNKTSAFRTCHDELLTSLATPVSTVPQGLAATLLPTTDTTGSYADAPRLLGLDGSLWFGIPVTGSADLHEQPPATAITALAPNGTGDVCLSSVNVDGALTAADSLPCPAEQLTFVPKLEQLFATGFSRSCAPTATDTSIHGYDVTSNSTVALTIAHPTIPLSGGALSDGRKLYFGSIDGLLHRVDLATQTEQDSVSVSVTPDFVAVIPK
jgi:hypothetical protein